MVSQMHSGLYLGAFNCAKALLNTPQSPTISEFIAKIIKTSENNLIPRFRKFISILITLNRLLKPLIAL